jgi:hypothetical protein
MARRSLQGGPIKGDPRRTLFARQEELLGALNPEWRAQKAHAHALILRTAPFQDG